LDEQHSLCFFGLALTLLHLVFPRLPTVPFPVGRTQRYDVDAFQSLKFRTPLPPSRAGSLATRPEAQAIANSFHLDLPFEHSAGPTRCATAPTRSCPCTRCGCWRRASDARYSGTRATQWRPSSSAGGWIRYGMGIPFSRAGCLYRIP